MQCSTCRQDKDTSAFRVEPRNTSGFRSCCKTCDAARTRAYRLAQPEKVKESRRLAERKRRFLDPTLNKASFLKSRYRITFDQFQNMLHQQENLCLICKQPESSKRNGRLRTLSVDHNHATGEVRGLLCNRCNRMIGQAEDRPELLTAAAQYLKETSYGA